jgi:hypothetical protein
MTETEEPSRKRRIIRVVISITILSGVTVVLGYGGWLVLAITARLAGYDPETADGDLLRDRLVEWPDRNREVMRTDGREPLPLRP